jgi:hypothetical protein
MRELIAGTASLGVHGLASHLLATAECGARSRFETKLIERRDCLADHARSMEYQATV